MIRKAERYFIDGGDWASPLSQAMREIRRTQKKSYDKLLANFMGFVKLAAIAIWLK